MDRFAEQFFGRPGRSSNSQGVDTRGVTEQILHSFASSAAKRAMSYSDPDRKRSGGGFDAEDFHNLGGFVLEMMQGRQDNSAERRRKKEKKRRNRERERAQERDVKYERDFDISGEVPYVPKYSTKRRRRSSQSPLHVKFAEPLEDFDYPPPPRKQHRRRRHQREEEQQAQEDYERDTRRRQRRSRRQRPKIDLRTLKTDLEDMSSTIINLNARSAGHRDCEFYDKFVRKGGMLQERIGSTLGQIRGWEEEGRGTEYPYDYGDAYGYDEQRRERKERKRRRRERENRW
jgi:hypothetical protein